MSHPVVLIVSLVVGWYIGATWLRDLRSAKARIPAPGALPGATPAPARAVVAGAAGGLLLVGLETAGELQLGIAQQQTRITWLFAAYSVLAAPVIEEIIFRGWLVIEHRGRAVMWSGVVVASVIFALIHPFLWRWDDAGFAFTADAKGWFSTAIVFATSLWLYYVRLFAWNPRRSLLPCFAGHAVKNAGVVLVKAATGYVAGFF